MSPLAAPSLPRRSDVLPPAARIVGGKLTVQDKCLMGAEAEPAMRRLLEVAFSLPEVKSALVSLETGSVSFIPSASVVSNQVWPRLGALLRQAQAPGRVRADRLPLGSPTPGLPVRVSRLGQSLTTFRVRTLPPQRMRIAHPLLRNRHLKVRALELLGSVHGVVSARPSGPWGSVTFTYDPQSTSPEQVIRFLDNSWAVLLSGPLAPPVPRKLLLAGCLLAFAFTAQFSRRALLPWATLGVALYNLPNVIKAVRDLRRRQIGRPAMYTLGFAFLLWIRLPFVSILFSNFAEIWPEVASRLAMRAESRLFAPQRRRSVWARLSDAGGGEIQIDVAELQPGMIIVVRRGELVAADGTVVEGLASVQDPVLHGGRGITDKFPGDQVHAGAFVRDGSMAVRVVHAGANTVGAALGHALPRRPVRHLPSLLEVERIGNRNARPALLAALVMLLATRIPRYSQVIIRPDYITAPRLSAHLSAIEATAESLSGGALIRNPASLDRLLATDICVLDDGVDLVKRRVMVSEVFSAGRGGEDDSLRFAAAAVACANDPRAAALRQALRRRHLLAAQSSDRVQMAGVIQFRDETGSEIRVMAPALALQPRLYVPDAALDSQLKMDTTMQHVDPATRSIAVIRGREVMGLVRFARSGSPEATEAVAALRLKLPGVRFVYLSSATQAAAERRAMELGVDAVFGGLAPNAKTEFIRSLSARALWVGDGSDSETAGPRAAAAVSVSIAGLGKLASDQADISLLGSDLKALSAVRLAAEKRASQLKADYRLVYLANLAGMAGGFLLPFGSLEVGVASNLGTAAVFVSRWRALNRVTHAEEM